MSTEKKINIRDVIDIDSLQKIQDEFSECTGLAAIIIDNDGEYVTKGSNFTDFCMKYTRNSKKGAEKCKQCDKEGKGVYYCHAGLMDFAHKLFWGGDQIGQIIGGQVLPKSPDENKIRQIARELDINEEAYIDALRKVPIRSQKQIETSANLLFTVVDKIIESKYLMTKENKTDLFLEGIQNIIEHINRMFDVTKKLKRLETQQNILSLNASIEAARANENGKGFSVVASQFGNVSRQFKDLNDEFQVELDNIKNSIDQIQQKM